MATRVGQRRPGPAAVAARARRARRRPSSPTALEHGRACSALPGTGGHARGAARAPTRGDADARAGARRLRAPAARRRSRAMAAALGGLDALVFTGGVGEHAPAVRAARGRRAGVPRRGARPGAQRGRRRRRRHRRARRAGRGRWWSRARGPRDRAPGARARVSTQEAIAAQPASRRTMSRSLTTPSGGRPASAATTRWPLTAPASASTASATVAVGSMPTTGSVIAVAARVSPGS